MDGLWIVLGIVLVIIVLIILDKIINSGYEKELITTLEKGWGKENTNKFTEEEFKLIKYYYEHICKETDVDDNYYDEDEVEDDSDNDLKDVVVIDDEDNMSE